MVVEKVVKGIWRVIDMTIDEAIEKENKIAKENQKIVDTQIVFDNVSISELYCDDTEVIEKHLSNYKKCAEYHEQIAEWLEDYKHIKQWKSDIMDSFCKYDVSSFEELVANVGNKAIDDFATKICEILEEYQTGFNMVSMANIWHFSKELAEQLKAGEK